MSRMRYRRLWIANRNALIGLCFGLVCLYAHLSWRQNGGKMRWLVAALLALVMALHANEGAIAVTGYLFGYALFLDKGSRLKRLTSLLPYAVVVVGWRAYYSALGFGAAGSATYVDPVSTPLRFIGQLLERGPVLLAAQLINLPATTFEFSSPRGQLLHWSVATTLVVLFSLVFLRALRHSKTAGFFATGMVLSIVPAVATFPTGRMLAFVSIGGAGLIAEALITFQQRRPMALLRGFLGSLHLVAAPLALLATCLLVAASSKAMATAYDELEYPPGIEEKVQFLIDPPNYFVVTYANIHQRLSGKPTPKATHTLSSNQAVPVELRVTRLDLDTLRMQPDGGFPYLLFRDQSARFEVGQRIELENLTVEVVTVTEQGLAQDVDYHFNEPLESPQYVWSKTRGLFGLEPYTPPAVGESHVFRAKADREVSPSAVRSSD